MFVPRVVFCVADISLIYLYIDDFDRHFPIFLSFDFRLLISCQDDPTSEISTIYHDISNTDLDKAPGLDGMNPTFFKNFW